MNETNVTEKCTTCDPHPPLFLSIDETRYKILSILNTSGIPLYILEMLLKDIWIDCRETNTQLKNRELMEYKNMLKQSNEEPMKN